MIYTDGACLGNPGPGGWAAIVIEGGQERELSGAEPASTNQLMELTAALEGLPQNGWRHSIQSWRRRILLY